MLPVRVAISYLEKKNARNKSCNAAPINSIGVLFPSSLFFMRLCGLVELVER